MLAGRVLRRQFRGCGARARRPIWLPDRHRWRSHHADLRFFRLKAHCLLLSWQFRPLGSSRQRRGAKAGVPRQDLPEHSARYGNIGHLERDVKAVADEAEATRLPPSRFTPIGVIRGVHGNDGLELRKYYSCRPNDCFLIRKRPLRLAPTNDRYCRRLPFAGIAEAIDCVIATKGWNRPK